MVVDNVFRFNLFGGQAVFLLLQGQTWNREICSLFDLDFVQNILIFDQKGNPVNDLIQILQVSSVPSTKELKVYRMITDKSFEQQMYLRNKRSSTM